MVERLISDLLLFPEIGLIVLTLNVPEKLKIHKNSRIKVINNTSAKGFGANHNAAFKFCNDDFFCIINPDILFKSNPFPILIPTISLDEVGLVAPLVINLYGRIEDSARSFLTPKSLFKRHFLGKSDAYKCLMGDGFLYPEWVGGMFMLVSSKMFTHIKGFDERYFLYVEDVDICTRIWLSGRKVLMDQNICVIHDARRASRKSFKHMFWHMRGVLRYFVKFYNRYPKTI